MKSLQKRLQHSIKNADKILSVSLVKIKGGTQPIADCQFCKAACVGGCLPGNA